MEAREARIRRHHLKLTQLSRSDTLRRGELEGALHEVTEAACTTLGVARSGVWLYDETRTRIECVDLYQDLSQNNFSNCRRRCRSQYGGDKFLW